METIWLLRKLPWTNSPPVPALRPGEMLLTLLRSKVVEPYWASVAWRPFTSGASKIHSAEVPGPE